MKFQRGFTIIEIIVAIGIIGILATLSVVGYTNVQKSSEDTRRSASATVVAESLEKYFAKHGEYPSVPDMTVTNANTVKQLLGITNINSLVDPKVAGGSTTNIWKTGAASADNPLTYSPNVDALSSCTTTSGACTDFKIEYYEEKTGTNKTILSRHKSLAPPPPTAPTAPTVAITPPGTNIIATSSTATCTSPAAPQYAYRTRTNDSATWSAYSGWSTTRTATTAPSQGVKYGYQFKARCLDGSNASADSPISAEATYIYPVSAPTMTALTNSTSGNITTWSWPAVTCAAGTTAVYSVNRGNDTNTTGAISWSGWTANQTGTTWPRDTASQGYNYTSVVRALCRTAFDDSGWSAESNYSSYLRPVAAPGGAYNWAYGIYNSRTIYRWTWAEPACGPGTARSYQWDNYIGDVNNANGWNMYWTDKGPYYRHWYGASTPSRQDPGWYDTPQLDMDYIGSSTPGGIDVYARIKYRCQNPQTLRTAEGAWTQSPNYWT